MDDFIRFIYSYKFEDGRSKVFDLPLGQADLRRMRTCYSARIAR